MKIKTFMDFFQEHFESSQPEMKEKKECPLCGMFRELTVDHHVYLYDDGNGGNAKYPYWTIHICRSCNQHISYLNRLIHQFLIQDVPIKNRLVSFDYRSNKDMLKLFDAISPLNMGLKSHYFRSNRARSIWKIITYLKEYDFNNRGDLFGR